MACASVGVALPADAQWTEFPLKNVPRLADGTVDVSAPAPTTREGSPDLSGVWWVRPGPGEKVPSDQAARYFLNMAADAKPGEVTMLPWALAFVQEQVTTPVGIILCRSACPQAWF